MSIVLGRKLRRAAHRYADYGWPIAPGAWWAFPQQQRSLPRRAGGGYSCGDPACYSGGLHPACDGHALADVAAAATTDHDLLDDWWAQHPYSLLAPTGIAVDVLELTGQAVGSIRRILDWPGAVAVMDGGTRGARRAYVFLTPGPLDQRVEGALLHQRGSWVPLPPSPLARPMEWLREPAAVGWRLPALAELRHLIAR